MTTAPAGGPGAGSPDAPAHRPGWLVLTASERGASHVASNMPNQDCVATERAGSGGVVAAVADGHGHSRHLRSARGSRFAVTVGCQVAQQLADRLEESSDLFLQRRPDGTAGEAAEQIAKLATEFLVPEIVQRWRDVVLADVQADPFSEAEQGLRHQGDAATIAYGSTLLLGIALYHWLILAQIGDGDVVGVRADGGAVEPVPADPQLDGLVTTSLCGADPEADFRIAVVDTVMQPLVALLLATDGYGNAQVVEAWPSAFSHDLAPMLKDRDMNWLASQLPSWAARCASADGSADDTTVALMVSPAVDAPRPGAGAESGSEEITIPAMPHADTVPAQVLEPHDPPEPVAMRQLAHRPAPEPVILERTSTARVRRPEDEEQPTGQEPATNQIPKLGPAGQTAEQGRSHEGHGDDSAEPPTTRWRLRRLGER